MDTKTVFVLEKYKDIETLPIFEGFNDKDYVLQKLNDLYIPVARLNKWQDYIALTESKFSNSKDFIFRGHPNPKWTLMPTLKRTHNFLTEEQINQILINLKDALKDVKHEEAKNISTLNENQLWALGRHYSLPTPLLDWTYNPKIALYFAYEDRANLFPYHSIYVLNIKKIPTEHLSYFNNQPMQNKREKNQQGCYIKIVNHNNLESIITNDKDNFTYFRKIYIKKNSPAECLKELEQKYQISKLFLYPDSIEGAVEYCKTQIPSPYEGGGILCTFRQEVTAPTK